MAFFKFVISDKRFVNFYRGLKYLFPTRYTYKVLIIAENVQEVELYDLINM
jgi:hypothetical protein